MKFGVVGWPVAHSLSPAIHSAAFDAASIAATYKLLPTPPDEFATVVEGLRAGRLAGVNVTTPHKVHAYDSVDRMSERASRTSSVNTIVVRDKELVGDNTDVAGVEFALGQLDGIDARAAVLVLGAGPAARAAMVACADRPLFVSSRRLDTVAAALESVDAQGTPVPWGEGVAGAVVVNATPIGSQGERLPIAITDTAAGLVDMNYADGVTPAVERMLARDLPAADGVDMLVGQAMEAFAAFTGLPAPGDVMMEAARRSTS